MNPNRSAHRAVNLNNQKPAGYHAPSDPTELIRFKVSAIRTAANILCSSLPAHVYFNTELLTQVLTDHLRNNPEAIDPYNTKIKINNTNGEIEIQHYDLTFSSVQPTPFSSQQCAWRIRPDGQLFKSVQYANGVRETGIWKENKLSNASQAARSHIIFGKRSWPNGIQEIGQFEYLPNIRQCGLIKGKVKDSQGAVVLEGRWSFNQASGQMEPDTSSTKISEYTVKSASLLNAILMRNFRLPQDAVAYLDACNHELKNDSGLAKLAYAIAKKDFNCLPNTNQLQGSLDNTGGNTPDIKPYLARTMLEKLATGMPPVLSVVRETFADRLIQNTLTLLKALNTSNNTNTIQTKTHLSQIQLEKLLTLLTSGLELANARHPAPLLNELEQFTSHLREKRARMLDVIDKPASFSNMPADARDDFDVAITAVRLDGWLLQFASDELRNDRDIVGAAVQMYGDALAFASQSLHEDREIIKKAVTSNGNSLRMAPLALRDDLEIVLAAVRGPAGFALKHASHAMRNNREVVLTAVRSRGQSLAFANIRLRNDHEIVMNAVSRWGTALRVASPALQNDRYIVLAAVKNNGLALRYASPTLRNNREVVMKAIQNKGSALQFASDALRNDPEIIMAAIQRWPPALRYAGSRFQNVQR